MWSFEWLWVNLYWNATATLYRVRYACVMRNETRLSKPNATLKSSFRASSIFGINSMNMLLFHYTRCFAFLLQFLIVILMSSVPGFENMWVIIEETGLYAQNRRCFWREWAKSTRLPSLIISCVLMKSEKLKTCSLNASSNMVSAKS